MMQRFRPKLTRIIWAVTIAACVIYYGKWGREAYNFYGDALSYYVYLPATFIYNKNDSIERLPPNRGIRGFIIANVATVGSATPAPKGHRVNQYTYGVALMEAPAFFAAHAIEKMRGGLANGFTPTYQYAVAAITIMYGILGLWLTYRLLRRLFPKPVASITTALLLLGTNLFWFTLHQYGMAHVPLFFLFAALANLTVLAHERGRWWHFAGPGLVAGIITLIRPVDVACLIIPFCYSAGRPFIKAKLAFLRRNLAGIFGAACCFVLPLIPQMLYWRRLTGHFIYDSYGPSQRLSMLHPHIAAGLWGASNGWLLFTPLMLLAIAGIFLPRRLGPFAYVVPLLLALYVWVVYAWYLPNYPNGLGSRPMIDIYALLALPLAAAVKWIGDSRAVVKVSGCVLIALFCALNLSFTVQQATGIIWSEESKYAFHFRTLFRYHLRYEDLVVWDIGIPQPDPRSLQNAGAPTMCGDLPDSAVSPHIVPDSAGRTAYRMLTGEEYGDNELMLRWSNRIAPGARWVQCSGRFFTPEAPKDIWSNHMLVVSVTRGAKSISWYGLRINNKIGLAEGADTGKEEPGIFSFRAHQWGQVSFFAPIPPDIRNGDELKLSIWNMGKQQIDISGLCMTLYK